MNADEKALREKVLKAMEIHTTNPVRGGARCTECPYFKDDGRTLICSDALIADAFYLLKPRLITKNGFNDIPGNEYVWGWIECSDLAKEAWLDMEDGWGKVDRGWPVGWRAWTSEPSESQRKTTKWDERNPKEQNKNG